MFGRAWSLRDVRSLAQARSLCSDWARRTLGHYVATERDGRSEVATICFELSSDFSVLSSVKLFSKKESISKSIHRGNSCFLPRTFWMLNLSQPFLTPTVSIDNTIGISTDSPYAPSIDYSIMILIDALLVKLYAQVEWLLTKITRSALAVLIARNLSQLECFQDENEALAFIYQS